MTPCNQCGSIEWKSLTSGVCDVCRGCVTPEDIADMTSKFDVLYSRLVDADKTQRRECD